MAADVGRGRERFVMTHNARFKAEVREYAKQNGLSYTAALRLFESGEVSSAFRNSKGPASAYDDEGSWDVNPFPDLLQAPLSELYLAVPADLPESLTHACVVDARRPTTAGPMITRYLTERAEERPWEFHQDEETILVRLGGVLPAGEAEGWVSGGAAVYDTWSDYEISHEEVAVEFTKDYELLRLYDVIVDPDFSDRDESSLSGHRWADGGQW